MKSLSTREKQVLRFLALGRTTSNISDELGITRHTVLSYLAKSYAKLGAINGYHAVAIAISDGHIPPVTPEESKQS